jgi:hypothetical protein
MQIIAWFAELSGTVISGAAKIMNSILQVGPLHFKTSSLRQLRQVEI